MLKGEKALKKLTLILTATAIVGQTAMAMPAPPNPVAVNDTMTQQPLGFEPLQNITASPPDVYSHTKAYTNNVLAPLGMANPVPTTFLERFMNLRRALSW
jgi:hypothetical protein